MAAHIFSTIREAALLTDPVALPYSEPMGKNDRKHFQEYREQTRVKHEILEKYLAAYLHILKRTNKNLMYFDGFAGPGVYTDQDGGEFEGSPLRALKLIAGNDEFAKRVTTRFCEKDSHLHASLKQRLGNFYAANPSIREPEHDCSTFADGLAPIVEYFEKHDDAELAPSFIFVDPCGVGGVNHDLLVRVMRNTGCELFIFFNIDGVKRILGLADLGPTLPEVFGSEKEAEMAKAALAKCNSSTEKEAVLVSHYYDLLKRTIDTEFVTGFRVEYENRRVVSHYFIHVTRSGLAYRIMKSIMWGLGRTESGRGGLALAQASTSQTLTMIDPEWDTLRASIISELRAPRKAQHFYDTLSEQPGNLYCDKAYREALLELEEEGTILVVDKKGKLTTAATRPKRKGQSTLSAPHTIKLNAQKGRDHERR